MILFVNYYEKNLIPSTLTHHQDEEDEEDEGDEPDGPEELVGGLDGRVVEVAEDLPELRERREHERAVLLHLKASGVDVMITIFAFFGQFCSILVSFERFLPIF
jgi:hypothetical protein